MNPVTRRDSTRLSTDRLEALARTARRRTSFPSFEDVFERYRKRDAFRAWQPELLDLYVRHGFAEVAGGVELRCVPSIEGAMLVHIYAVMEDFYCGDVRGNPFEDLVKIDPGRTCVSTAKASGEIYKRMARIAKSLIPGARSVEFAAAGHSVAQERPEEVVRAVREFWERRD